MVTLRMLRLRGECAEDGARLDLAHLGGERLRVPPFGGEIVPPREDQVAHRRRPQLRVELDARDGL